MFERDIREFNERYTNDFLPLDLMRINSLNKVKVHVTSDVIEPIFIYAQCKS